MEEVLRNILMHIFLIVNGGEEMLHHLISLIKTGPSTFTTTSRLGHPGREKNPHKIHSCLPFSVFKGKIIKPRNRTTLKTKQPE
jgi:hypothetical protein